MSNDRKYRIRSGSGLGDNIYLYSIVKHLRSQGLKIEIATKYPDLFDDLDVDTAPKSKKDIDIVAHYTRRKGIMGTSQFEDMVLSAKSAPGLQLDFTGIKYEIKHQVKNHELIRKIRMKAGNKKIMIVALPREPFGRTDGFGVELSPNFEKMQLILNHLKDRYYYVQIGTGVSIYDFKGIDMNLANRTTINDLMDLASICHGMIAGGCCFVIPLGESFNKPFMIVWSSKGLASKEVFISSIKPEKVLHKGKHGGWVIDSWKNDRIIKTAEEFFNGSANV